MVTYIVYNNKTGKELIFDDFIHAETQLKHLVQHEQHDETGLSSNWDLCSHIS